MLVIHSPEVVAQFSNVWMFADWVESLLELGWAPVFLHPFGLGRQRDRLPDSVVMSNLHPWTETLVTAFMLQHQASAALDGSLEDDDWVWRFWFPPQRQ